MNTGIPGHDMAILTMTADQLLYIVAGVGKTRNETKRNRNKSHTHKFTSNPHKHPTASVFSVFFCAMACPQPQQC